MSGIFQTVLTLSLAGTFCIFIVLLARLLLRRAPKRFSYILWAIVFIRLICPVFPESRFSLIPQTLVTGQAQGKGDLKENAYVATVVSSNNENLRKEESGTDVNRESNLKVNKENNWKETQLDNNQNRYSNNNSNKNNLIIAVFTYIWIAGIIVLAVYHITSYWRFKNRIKKAREVEKGVKEVSGEYLSFVFGIINPTIYLSQGLDGETRKVILYHEGVHLLRRDYIIKPLTLAISCIHWFNPFVWLAFYLMNKDCEMSCDEKVVNRLGEESKKIYSYALLNEATRGLHTRKKGTVSSLISFGEDGVKSRIKHVLNYKKAPFWIIVSAMIILILLSVCFLSNPKGKQLTQDDAIEAVRKVGGYGKEAKSRCFLQDYEGDKQKEAFVEIGEIEDSYPEYIYGDLWLISEEGETTLLLEDVYLSEEQEIFESDNMKFLLASYIKGNPTLTNVYGVSDNKAENKISYGEEKYIEGNTIVCVQSDYDLDYDIESDIFTGHTYKNYAFYYKDGNFLPYAGSDLTREEFATYENGEEILDTLEQKYPDARFQYIIRENNLLYINIASTSDTSVRFSYMTYGIKDRQLNFVEEGEGCYKRNINDENEVTFAEEIANYYRENEQSEKDKADSIDNREKTDNTKKTQIFGYMDYTGWLDECTIWTDYEEFLDQDYDGDGVKDRVYKEVIPDNEDGDSNYRIAFGNGDELMITGIGTGFPKIQGIDLTGDGINEIIASFTYGFSTNPASFGENLIFEKTTKGYERLKWPADIESAMKNQNIPEITLHYEREKDSYHVTCLELAKEAPIDVKVDIEENQWKQGYDDFDGEDFKYPMYKLKVVESEGELPYLVGTFSTFDKWTTHDIQVTFAYEGGKLIIKKSNLIKR
jgi:beta-lactamase regulating signal transducer with metallopeptidase domain